MKILLIESNHNSLNYFQDLLRLRKYAVSVATDGQTGLSMALHARFDLILVDTQLPRLNGFDLVRQLRLDNDTTPVMLIASDSNSTDRVKGLYAGADDYVQFPVEPDELLARIYALHRRRTGGFNGPTILSLDSLELNLAEKVAYRANKRIRLTAREFQLLEFLLKNAGRVVSKSQILEKVWDASPVCNTNKVEVYINFLRKKIDQGYENKLIHTTMGLGYLLQANP